MPDLQRYFTAKNYRRFMLSLWVLITGGAGYCYWILSGEQQRLTVEKLQNAQRQETVRHLSQRLSALPAGEADAPAPAPPLFSVADMLQGTGGRLQIWRPEKPVSQLELSLIWEKVPGIFQHLARYKGADLKAFSIKAGPSSGRVSLTLEFRYATH